MRRASLGMVLLVALAISFAIQGQPEEIELVLEQGLNEYEGTRDTTIYEGPENSNGGGRGSSPATPETGTPGER